MFVEQIMQYDKCSSKLLQRVFTAYATRRIINELMKPPLYLKQITFYDYYLFYCYVLHLTF